MILDHQVEEHRCFFDQSSVKVFFYRMSETESRGSFRGCLETLVFGIDSIISADFLGRQDPALNLFENGHTVLIPSIFAASTVSPAIIGSLRVTADRLQDIGAAIAYFLSPDVGGIGNSRSIQP